MNIDQSAMCYISMTLPQRALQPNEKVFKILNWFLNYWLKTEKYSTNNKVGFMQARWGEAIVLISTRSSSWLFL